MRRVGDDPFDATYYSPMEGHADRRAVQAEVDGRIVGLEVVVDVSPYSDDVAPVERVAETPDRLPGELRLARSHIDVIGHIPFPTIAERKTPLSADDRVPPVDP